MPSSPSLRPTLVIVWQLRSARCFATSSRQMARSLLPTTPARTRFAPSPTGSLHLGSLRTALYNFLLSRATNGTFILRLEDTDSRRTVPGAEDALYHDLQWAGLQWDEGPLMGGPHGPYRQSERTAIYRAHAAELVAKGTGYRCFCTPARLDELARRRQALGMPTDYDRTCAHMTTSEAEELVARGEKYIVRLKAPDTYPPFSDLVYGKVGKDGGAFNAGVTIKQGEIAYEDPVLLKSDGTPTYHLANVVDDHLMKITHVVRASEWLPSTPKHLALYQAFGWEPPQFAHVGLLVDGQGRKLSKRQMDTGIASFRQRGVLARSLLNFAALLGWSHTRRGDIMDLEELIEVFSTKFTKGNATVDEGKLWFLQRAHAARIIEKAPSDPRARQDVENILDMLEIAVRAQFSSDFYDSFLAGRSLRTYLREIFAHDARNFTSADAFVERNCCFFRDSAVPVDIPEWLVADASTTQAMVGLSDDVVELVDSGSWTHEDLDHSMKSTTLAYAQRLNPLDAEQTQQTQKGMYKLLCKYLRWALVEANDGPGLGWTMTILGKEACLHRIEAAKARVSEIL